MDRHVPVARLAAIVAVAVGAFLVAHQARGPRWRTVRPGVEFATLSGGPICRHGSPEIALLRLDPARVRLRVLHYTRLLDRRPLNIVQWQVVSHALAVFNAGQFYSDYSYMGLLVSEGKVVSRKLHPKFRAALVASPVDGDYGARVLDLDREPLDPDSLGWREVAQSFMLFDRSGVVRVRRSDQAANRTVIGQDRSGRLLVITSEGGYTLRDFALLLRSLPLALTHAMSMDGGYEAELCVNAGRFRYASFGHWDGRRQNADAPGAQVPLPAVVAVSAP